MPTGGAFDLFCTASIGCFCTASALARQFVRDCGEVLTSSLPVGTAVAIRNFLHIAGRFTGFQHAAGMATQLV